MTLLLYKLTLSPLLVIAATLAGRRWGQTVAGLIAGFPIVAGPILVFYALEQGSLFAASAAQSTLLGIIALNFFALAYAWRAWMEGSVLSCVFTGWAFFALGTLIITRVHGHLWQAVLWALASLFLARRSLPRMAEAPPVSGPSAWDLPIRAVAAALLVLLLTYFAQALGPVLGGFLASFPVASTVLAVFAQRQGGGAAAVAVLKGLLLALNSFAGFCVVLCLALPTQSVAVSFSAALAVALAVQALVFWMTQKM